MHFGGTWAASNCDATVAVLGLTPVMEGEEGDAFLAAHGGDRTDLSLPAAHIAFLKALRKSIGKKPLILVITAGSAVDLSTVEPYADAILLAWYPGEQGGNALADIIFGKVSPSGHLPVTFYRSLGDLPDDKDYGMKGRTYRYCNGPVQYPFGYGLSYASFDYTWQAQPKKIYTAKDSITFSITVTNKGDINADEVGVQAYIEYRTGERMPLKELKAFRRISISAHDSRPLSLCIPVSELQKWDLAAGKWKLYRGEYKLVLGSHSRDEKLVTHF